MKTAKYRRQRSVSDRGTVPHWLWKPPHAVGRPSVLLSGSVVPEAATDAHDTPVVQEPREPSLRQTSHLLPLFSVYAPFGSGQGGQFAASRYEPLPVDVLCESAAEVELDDDEAGDDGAWVRDVEDEEELERREEASLEDERALLLDCWAGEAASRPLLLLGPELALPPSTLLACCREEDGDEGDWIDATDLVWEDAPPSPVRSLGTCWFCEGLAALLACPPLLRAHDVTVSRTLCTQARSTASTSKHTRSGPTSSDLHSTPHCY